MDNYCFELITGPMSCGKTEELLRRVRRCIIAKKKVIVISPDVDTRAGGDYIESRNGLWLEAVKVKHAVQILSIVKDAQIVAIDELQFFDKNIVPVITKLMNDGKKVIGTGLELDFKAEPFGSMPELMCIATQVDKLHAVCMKCGCENATRTQRLIDGKPADKSSPLIMIGGDETYEARCIKCYELPDVKHKAKFMGLKLLQFNNSK
ncbi:MAG TPA: thymidine kinase [Cyanobacteria bacterium UBA11991]|nr:thymidine kinase [Cyanobacteriota bacterium]MDY6358664.1 thymidine kinase [Cyanobacteriota bacterium]MDY6363681.1 thymidine kinase [Cyanobacteriota bacterium]MDY6382561.1 thymidine kinase [Cyanobacteriota bacterium]HCB11500.1 thymidine kinase [Cyanobacteria bacterium UBA11991]